MGGKARFKKGQKCLVPHTDQHYPAHILQAQKRGDEGYFYLVHYDGWSKKYDEWVEEDGLLKFDASLLPPEAGGTGGTSTAAATAGGAAAGQDSAAPTAGGGTSVRKRKVAETGAMEAPPDTQLPLQLRLHMPALLKKVVLDDHDLVTHQVKLQPLPRRPCVSDILRTFERSKAGEGGAADSATLEVVAGLQSYFDAGLKQLLLYQQEVLQYEEAVSGGRTPSDVYGGEHLVRLLVKLPELVPVATMGAQNVVMLEGRLHELMSLLVDKQAQFFLPSSAYQPNPHFEPPLPLPPLPQPAPAAAAPPAAAPAAAAPAAVPVG